MNAGTFERILRPSALTPGTAVLVTGPALSGKRELLLSLLSAGTPEERGTVFVTTRRDATSTGRDLRERGVPDDRLSVVDCVSRERAFERVRDAVGRRYVADPGDLTGLGIAVTEFLREHHRSGTVPWLGCHTDSRRKPTTSVVGGIRPTVKQPTSDSRPTPPRQS